MSAAKYHISPKVGVALCRAKERKCRYGEASEHYSSAEEALAAYEKQQSASLFPEPSSRKELWGEVGEDGWLTDESAQKALPHGVYCPSCNQTPSLENCQQLLLNDYATCSCGKWYDIGEAKVELLPDNPSHKFLKPEAVYEATWYHATWKDNWLETNDDGDESFSIHVGTEQASYDRGIGEYVSRVPKHDGEFYLYEVRVKPEAPIAKDIADDDNGVEAEDGEVVRYINRWEDMASISLAVPSDKVEIVSKKVVGGAKAKTRISLYNVRP